MPTEWAAHGYPLGGLAKMPIVWEIVLGGLFKQGIKVVMVVMVA